MYSVYNLVVNGIKQLIQVFANGLEATFGDMIAKGERKNLVDKFNLYEIIYYTICTIFFSCAIVLIVPFITVYTNGVTDVNYIRYFFGYLIVISQYIWAIRLPYSSITLAAGHFKETRNGAWVEAISNIIISIVLVIKYGIIGVTIGTIFAMTIRTFEFIYHVNKYILERNIFESIIKISMVIVETTLIFLISAMLPFIEGISYLNWIINAFMIFLIACIITLCLNSVMYRKSIKEIIKVLKNLLKRKQINVIIEGRIINGKNRFKK